MITYLKGDLFQSEAEALVNPVNCVGVMGKGLALKFKQKFPENFICYRNACLDGEVVPGKMLTFNLNQIICPRYIINFPTKRHWRSNSSLEDIQSGLVDLVEVVKDKNIMSIAIPALGCGEGNLDWQIVKNEINVAFQPLPYVKVLLYEPL